MASKATPQKKKLAVKRKAEDPVVASEPVIIRLKSNVNAGTIAKYQNVQDVEELTAAVQDDDTVTISNKALETATSHLFFLEGVLFVHSKYAVKEIKSKKNGKSFKIEETNFMFKLLGDEDWNSDVLQEQIKSSDKAESPHALLVALETKLREALNDKDVDDPVHVSVLGDNLVLFAKSGADEKMVAVENFDGTQLTFEELFKVEKKGAEFNKQHGNLLCNAAVKIENVYFNEKGGKFFVNLRLVKLQLKNVKIDYKEVY